jgi:hypothetical protein
VTLPAPPTHHKLEAATRIFSHQLGRTQAYLDAVLPALRAQNESEKNIQYCYQTIVLMLHAFMEEHYRVLVSQATLYQPDAVRRHLMKRRAEHAATIEETLAPQLMQTVCSEVDFSGGAKKLHAIFALLFSVGPFADDDAQAKCLDLVKARNIITHQGGKLDQKDVPQFASPDLVVRSRTAGALTVNQLHIQPVFLNESVLAFGRSLIKIDASLRQDPRYSF